MSEQVRRWQLGKDFDAKILIDPARLTPRSLARMRRYIDALEMEASISWSVSEEAPAELVDRIADRVAAQLSAPAPPDARDERIVNLQAAIGYEIEKRDAALARVAELEARLRALAGSV